MALADIRVGVRFKPDTFRSSQETVTMGSPAIPAQTIEGPDGNPVEIPEQPATQAVVMNIQLVAFDSSMFGTGNPYVPGAEPTERHIYILDQKTVQLDVAAFAGKTVNQSIALWQGVLDDAYDEWADTKDVLLLASGAPNLVPYKVYPV